MPDSTKLSVAAFLVGAHRMRPCPGSPSRRLALAAMLSCICLFILASVLPPAAQSDVNPNLVDNYLERQFDWAMYVDVRNLDHYLNYKGSRLRPLTRARVYYNKYTRPHVIGTTVGQSLVYQDLWYYQGKPVGLRRRAKLAIEPETVGTIVAGNFSGVPGQAEAATNAMVRLLVEMQLRNIVITNMVVPGDQFQNILDCLRYYRFHIANTPTDGKQLSILLRSLPPGREEYLYLQR